MLSADWIQAAVALLVLGGVLGGFGAELYRRRRSNNGGTGVMQAVLTDQGQQREELWEHVHALEAGARAAEALARQERDTCTLRIESLERLGASLSRRLEECLSRMDGERRSDVP